LKRHVVAVPGNQCVQRRIWATVTSSPARTTAWRANPIGFCAVAFRAASPSPFRLDQGQHFPRPGAAGLG
jgi:hypothetical protein